ncbi:MAG: 30S ribosomal protein S9 [Patescibacteria group bacterium]
MTTATHTYFEAVGRRKTAVARVRITKSDKNSVVVNDRKLEQYFPIKEHQMAVTDPLVKSKPTEFFSVSAKVNGGGINGQAEAVRHGISRALLEFDLSLRGKLKKLGFLKRDPRAKERRKFGLKKARKSPQWSKR